MTIKDIQETADVNTSSASLAARQLALAGIAIIWIFNQIGINEISIQKDYIIPLYLFSLTLAFDLIQYTYAGIAWNILTVSKEKKDNKSDHNYVIGEGINVVSYIFFISKILTVGYGYYYLLIKLIHSNYLSQPF